MPVKRSDPEDAPALKPQESIANLIRESEPEVVASFADLINDKNETAAVNACIKVLEMVQDKGTPARLRELAMDLLEPAIERLKQVSSDGTVGTARVNATGALMKQMRLNYADHWPPDVKLAKWKKRMKKAYELCALPA